MNSIRVGILVHGCNLGADSWEDIVWGDRQPQHLGRLTRMLLLYLQFQEVVQNAEVASIVLGTGVVGIDAGQRTGHCEAEETQQLLFERLDEIARFGAIAQQVPQVTDAGYRAKLKEDLHHLIHLATNCHDTNSEIREAADHFLTRDVNTVILVSSPVHLPRCLKDACQIFREAAYAPLRDNLLAAPSTTCYLNSLPDQVAIFEPPHRTDRPRYDLFAHVNRMTRVLSDKNETRVRRFMKELDQLIERYKRERDANGE